ALVAEHPKVVVAELREALAAHSTGEDAVALGGGDREAREVVVAVLDRFGERDLLSVEAVRVVGVLDVTAEKDRSVRRFERRSDLILRVGDVCARRRVTGAVDEFVVVHARGVTRVASNTHRDSTARDGLLSPQSLPSASVASSRMRLPMRPASENSSSLIAS